MAAQFALLMVLLTTTGLIDEVLEAVPALVVAALDPDLPVTSRMPMTSLARLNEPVASLAVLSASFAIAPAPPPQRAAL